MKYALIPARGGSKGLPGKNILEIKSKPVIAYTIEAAISSGIFSKVCVSSDFDEILAVAASYGAETIKRPERYANDTASSDVVVEHFIEAIGLAADDSVCLLQPTSPLRTAEHIAEASRSYDASRGSSVYSMTEASECVFKAFASVDGRASGYFGKNAPFSRRQDFPEVFFANGAIYFFSVKSFLTEKKIPRTDIVPYMMDKKSSMDLDTKDDLIIINALMGE